MPFDPQPTLVGTLLELRPLRADDFDVLYAVAADPLIWEQHPAHDRHERAVFERFFQDALDGGGALAAIDRATGRVVGSSRYHGHRAEGFDRAPAELEIGWTFLARSHWGGRYNGEMKRLMLAHAFATVPRVVFLIGPHNRRSRRAVEKIGGLYAGTRTVEGRESVVYELTPERFAEQPSG